jgi:plastocyanin
MRLACLKELAALGMAVAALACGGDGGTAPPGPPAQLVRSGPAHQDWYFNNPLPAPYSVTVRDVNDRALPNVAVDWTITGGGGGTFSDDPSMTNANGVATTTHTLGLATNYVVIAAVRDFPAVPTVTFTANASAPPTSAAVDVLDNRFDPSNVVVQTGGSVTWTWMGALSHNVTFTSGPTPHPPNLGDRTTSTGSGMFTTVGTHGYTCTNHEGMNGSVTVVN